MGASALLIWSSKNRQARTKSLRLFCVKAETWSPVPRTPAATTRFLLVTKRTPLLLAKMNSARAPEFALRQANRSRPRREPARANHTNCRQ